MIDHPGIVVVAVAVAYNPGPGEIERMLAATLPQVAALVLVDNGSREDPRRFLPPEVAGKVNFLPLGDNLGIAAALNRGIAAARELDASHVLLLDQDSEPATDCVAKLLATHLALERQGEKVAAVGPRYLDPRQANPPPFLRFRGLRLERCRCDHANDIHAVDYLISSGCLISLATLAAVGGMRENLFIDYVDIEWGLRARSRGYQSFGVCAAHMAHQLGDMPIRKWGSNFPVRSPLRHYYLFRNAVLLYRQAGIPWNWKVVDGYRLLLKFGFYASFAQPRRAQIAMMSRGLWDGLRGRNGRFEPQNGR